MVHNRYSTLTNEDHTLVLIHQSNMKRKYTNSNLYTLICMKHICCVYFESNSLKNY